MDHIEELKAKRFQFLKKLYDKSDGDTLKICDIYSLGETLGFDKKTNDKITQYLIHEGLIKWELKGAVSITHAGLCEVEEALSNPDKSTEHFPPVNIISIGSIGQMISSQIQQAGDLATQGPSHKKGGPKEVDPDVIVESLRKEFLIRTQRELQNEKSRIGRKYQIAGMSHSSPYVKAILHLEFEHKRQLFDHILKTIEKDLPDIPLSEFKGKLFTVIEQEYDKIIPVTENLPGFGKSQIEDEKGSTKEIVDGRCVISQGKVRMNKKTIFISHAKEDTHLAEAIKTQIDKVFGKGLQVFVSSIPGIIEPGSDWFDRILDSLIGNNAFVVLVTSYSQNRAFVWFEIGFSWLRRIEKQCEIYVLCAPPIHPGKLPEPLCRLQAISLAVEDETKALFSKLIDQFDLGNLDTLDFAKIRESLPKCPEEDTDEGTQKIRSEVISNEIVSLLLGGNWYRAELLISHLSRSFPERSVVDQLTKMEKEGAITWGDGPMKADSKVRLAKSAE